MHTIKNVSERVVKLITGISDSTKVRDEESARGRFQPLPSANLVYERGIPTAKFRLSKNELILANSRSLLITTPHGFDWASVEFFKKTTHLKSVRWMQILSAGILKYCIRGLLGSFQRKALFEMCDVVSLSLAEDVDVSSLDMLEYRLHRVLCLLERDFPVTIQVIMLHLLHHLPMYIRRFGPVYEFWMFPVERFNSWIARRALNRRFPESTVLETYRLFEVSFFMQITDNLPVSSVPDFSELDLDMQQDAMSCEAACTFLLKHKKLTWRSTIGSLLKDLIPPLKMSVIWYNFASSIRRKISIVAQSHTVADN